MVLKAAGGLTPAVLLFAPATGSPESTGDGVGVGAVADAGLGAGVLCVGAGVLCVGASVGTAGVGANTCADVSVGTGAPCECKGWSGFKC